MRRNGSRWLVILTALALGFAWACGTSARMGGGDAGRTRTLGRAPAIIDNDDRMDANNLDMVVTNHGSIAFDLLMGNAGLVYPKATTHTVVFAGGIWIAASVGGQLRAAIGEYSQEFVPGPMLGGTFQPDQPAFRNYRVERGGAGYSDYLLYAVPQGAPVDAQGDPLLYGDVTIWSVFNDADPGLHTNDAGGTDPLGVEVQQTVFAFNRAGPLGNVIFVKWKLMNKGGNTLQDAYVSVWSDPDLGGFADDLVGCDTTLGLGYCYNATNSDGQYGSSPPAVGFQLLRSPVVERSPGVYDTLGLAAFSKYINGTDPTSPYEAYNYMRGLHADGTPMHEYDDPAQPITTFAVSGDPVMGTGWLDSNPADRRMQLSSGPFTMAAGDTQEVVAAILVGQGADRLSSVTELRSIAAVIEGYPFEPVPVLSISAPAEETVGEGQTLAFTVTSHDPEGTASLSASGLPLGATFSDLGDGTGRFEWTPGFDQAGAYTVTFTAHGTDGSTAAAVTVIYVLNVNRKPVADPRGPYTAFVGVPVSFDGSGSSDPDGDLLSYFWEFGDDVTGTGPAPSHAYAFQGLYGVALRVSDGLLTDIATTTAEIVERFSARAFTAGGNRTIRLSAGKPQWCVEIEPVGRSFGISFVDPATIVMISPGTGIVDRIGAIAGKTAVGADRDGNGIEELTVCFAKDALRELFSEVQGKQSIPVTIEGVVATGGEFRAALDVAVIASGGPLAASVDPNPLSGGGTLRFLTRTPGRITVSLFDPGGRLVRRVWESAAAGPGLHRVPLDGRDAAGRALGSGVYFYRIETTEGIATGHLLILK